MMFWLEMNLWCVKYPDVFPKYVYGLYPGNKVDIIIGMNRLEINQMVTICLDKLVQCVADCKSSGDV